MPVEPVETSEDGGGLYTVLVRGPGRASWRMVVRATDQTEAARKATAAGNEVVSVEQGLRKDEVRTTWARLSCSACKYPLRNLPEHAGQVRTCPECGTINFPEILLPPEPRLRHRLRRSTLMFVLLLIVFIMMLLMIRAR